MDISRTRATEKVSYYYNYQTNATYLVPQDANVGWHWLFIQTVRIVIHECVPSACLPA